METKKDVNEKKVIDEKEIEKVTGIQTEETEKSKDEVANVETIVEENGDIETAEIEEKVEAKIAKEKGKIAKEEATIEAVKEEVKIAKEEATIEAVKEEAEIAKEKVTVEAVKEEKKVDDRLFVRINEYGDECKDGKYITFGHYPNALKDKDVEIVSLSANSNGYYLGSDDCEYMAFIATPASRKNKFADGRKIKKKTTYYFKVEAIIWRILSEENNKALLLAESIIDNHAYNNTKRTKKIGGNKIFANNWEYSEMRKWLNNDLYNKAFKDMEKMIIMPTTFENKQTAISEDQNVYAMEQNNTSDKIGLLSYNNVLKPSFGFLNDEYEFDLARRKKVTEYAISAGAFVYLNKDKLIYANFINNGWWYLRSPHTNSASSVSRIHQFGVSDTFIPANKKQGGVVPVITLKLK